MKPQRKAKVSAKPQQPDKSQPTRNRALHIPLEFEKAVEGLLNVKPKKKLPKK